MRKSPIVVIAVLALVGVAAIVVANVSGNGLKLPGVITPGCTVNADGEVSLDTVQMANAATIAAVGVRRGMPEQGIVVALATALQESKLENLDTGDRDSVGLFQQRPSQGWGAPEKIKDPRYAADRFYTALNKVKGWQSMRVTDAAQRVQRSAYPNAYEKWADEGRVLAKALTGQATGAVACVLPGSPALRGAAAATAVLTGLHLDWGSKLAKTATTTEPGGLTVAVSDPGAGWRYAHWLVSHASETGLERVRFGNLEWSAPDGHWAPSIADGGTDQAKVIAQVFS